jgi:hypothetical protein
MWNEPNDENSFGSWKGNHTPSNVPRVTVKGKHNRTGIIGFCLRIFNSQEKHRFQSFNQWNIPYENFRGISYHIVVPFI